MTYFTDPEYLPCGAFSNSKTSLWHYATGEPASAESSSRALGGFCQQRSRHWKQMRSVHIPPVVQQLFQEGKMSAARAIPAISGGLKLVGVVTQAFVLLELEGDTFKWYLLNVLFKNFQISVQNTYSKSSLLSLKISWGFCSFVCFLECLHSPFPPPPPPFPPKIHNYSVA